MSSLDAKRRSGRVVGTLVITTCILLGIVWLLGHLLLAFNPNAGGTVVADLQTASYESVQQKDDSLTAEAGEQANHNPSSQIDSADVSTEVEDQQQPDTSLAHQFEPYAESEPAADAQDGDTATQQFDFSDAATATPNEPDVESDSTPAVAANSDDPLGDLTSRFEGGFQSEAKAAAVDADQPADSFEVPSLLGDTTNALSAAVETQTNTLEETVRAEVANAVAENGIVKEATTALPPIEKAVEDTRIEPATVNRIAPKYEPNTIQRQLPSAKRTGIKQRVYPVRTWTSGDSKQVEARFVSQDKESVILSVSGKLYRVPFTRFSQRDLDYLNDLKNETLGPVNN